MTTDEIISCSEDYSCAIVKRAKKKERERILKLIKKLKFGEGLVSVSELRAEIEGK